MQITKNKVVTLEFILKNEAGEVLDSSEDEQPLVYLHGANNLIPGLESELEGKESGDKFEITIPAKDGYGERDDGKVIAVSKEMFPDDPAVEAGAQYQSEDNDGNPVQIIVVEVNENEVKVDGNHPLAGVDLYFSVSISEVRDATEDELSHGHVHGAGGVEH